VNSNLRLLSNRFYATADVNKNILSLLYMCYSEQNYMYLNSDTQVNLFLI
jgi:hypothetical protein